MTEGKEKKESPEVNIKFLFLMCNDIDAIRNFYTNLLGMQEVAYMNEDDFGYLNYRNEGFDFMFFRTHGKIPIDERWTWQPGYEGGDRDAVSWAVQIPESDFPATVKRLQEAGVKDYQKDPEWRQDSYWGYSVMDPMCNTVEVYTSPKEKPESPEWTE